MPRYKFKKIHKNTAQTIAKIPGKDTGGRLKTLKGLLNSRYGWSLSSDSYGLIKASHLELIRRFLARQTLRKGKIFRKTEVTLPITKKGAQSRMGKGSGKIKFWVGFVRPGQVLFDIKLRSWSGQSGLNQTKGLLSRLRILNQKLPFSLKLERRSLELTRKERTCFHGLGRGDSSWVPRQ